LNDVENCLKNHIGKWIGLNYTIGEHVEQETVYGILKTVTPDIISIEGILTHNINRRNCTIQSIITRAKDGGGE